MDEFQIIYKILTKLKHAVYIDEFDIEMIDHTLYDILKVAWERLLYMLQNDGYIEGLVFMQSFNDYSPRLACPPTPRITLKGLEYLKENSMMKKMADLAKGVIKNL